MPVFGLNSTFLKLSTLVFQERELIIEEVHIFRKNYFFLHRVRPQCGPAKVDGV